jgi:murein DD-endopeptidase MepM/ murein hydrolase activator NlpD
VLIDHGGDVTTLYGHQSRLGSSVGQHVAQGQVIGYVGSTGNSTGPHLHFEIRFGDKPRDPRPYLPI